MVAIVAPMMSPLHPRQLTLLRIRALLNVAILAALVVSADLAWLRANGVPFGLTTSGAVLLLAAWVVVMPGRKYRSWGYDMADDELHIQHGLWTRTRTVVPFGRVQHIDVTQGPLERRFGLGTLILHTAGTRSSAVDLPGLDHGEAGRIRDHIRAKIRQDFG